jgi:molybdate transport system regulatory protein
LKRIEGTGSLHKAAAQMEMAYSKAWKLIQKIEQRLGFPLLVRRVGGPSGGGSQITPRAKELMLCYGRFRKEAKVAIEKIYQEQFASLSKSQERRRI